MGLETELSSYLLEVVCQIMVKAHWRGGAMQEACTAAIAQAVAVLWLKRRLKLPVPFIFHQH